MPLQMCPRCNHIHYVPGDCVTEARVVNGSLKREAVTPLPKPTTKKTGAASTVTLEAKRSIERARGPEKSTASRKGVGSSPAQDALPSIAELLAMRDALDTAPVPADARLLSHDPDDPRLKSLLEPLLTTAEAAAAHLKPAKKRGRPKGSTDRKAYQRELMRKRRAAKPHP